jgi:uncharacterized protein YqjF (DUF2071 family)
VFAPIAMRWSDVAFAHWRIAPGDLAPFLPGRLEPDVFDGDAWLSIVPFHITDLRFLGVPVPGPADVRELNLRTYVRGGGDTGVWFFTLECVNPVLVRAARITTGLPYRDARIASSERDGTIDFASVRRADRRVTFRAEYAAAGPAIPAAAGTLNAFLHERYAFFSERGSALLQSRVVHPPWAIAPATFTIAENTLAPHFNAVLTRPPDHCTFARGVTVRAALPHAPRHWRSS